MASLPTTVAPAGSSARRLLPAAGMTGFIVRRVLLGLVTLLIVSAVIFAATQLLPGDPAKSILGQDAGPRELAAVRERLGLDRPALQQYLDWLSGFVTGDFGTSITTGQPLTEVLGKRIGNSLILVLMAGAIIVPLGVALGAWAAQHRDRTIDHVLSMTTLALVTVPQFVVGIALIFVFASGVFDLLPAVSVIPPEDSPWQHLDAMVLPVMTLVIAETPYIARIARASMIEELESDYAETARLTGLPERRVVWRHAIPNALPPTVQAVALSLAYVTGAAVVIEYLFGYPGMGSALVEAVTRRDVPLVQMVAMLVATIYVVLNLLADVASILLTPRTRTSLR